MSESTVIVEESLQTVVIEETPTTVIVRAPGPSGASAGTVTSVDGSGGTTGLTVTGGPITSSGTLTLGGTLAVTSGGTGSTTASGARTALGLGSIATQDASSVTIAGGSITGITDLAVADGGTGSSTASGARSNLGAAASGANSDITSMTGITGGIATPDFVTFDTAASTTAAVGRLRWDSTQGTLRIGEVGGNVESDIGQTLDALVHNGEATTLNKGEVVYLHSAQGDKASVKRAYNTSDATSAKTFGVVAESIASGSTGLVRCVGVLEGLNLSAYNPGDTLYLGATAGTTTATKPYAPNHLVYVGIVERANAGNGRLYIRIQNGYELDEIHDVLISSPLAGALLTYDATNSLWKNARLNAGAGIAVTNADASVTVATSGALTSSGFTMSTSKLLGRTTASSGAVEEISVGSGLSLSGGSLTATNSGTVTSVDFSGGTTGLTVSGNPITSSGTITLSGTLGVAHGGTGATTLTGILKGNGTSAFSAASAGTDYLAPFGSQTANYVYASPNGTAGNPTFRALVADDIPTLNQNTTGTASNVTGTVAVANGGTGQTSYTDGQLLIGNSTGNTLTKATLTAGSGISITNGGGSITITSTAGGGSVTSVAQSFTGGLISVSGSPITSSGTLALTVAGTSGGIPYFSSGTTWASSGALAANAIVLGGGAGAAPATTTTGTGVVTAVGNAVNTTGGLVTQSGTLAASALLLGGGSGTAISSTTTGSGVVTALGNAANATGGFATINGTATLTNKRVDPRVVSAASASSLTPDISAADQYAYTALAANLAINAPTGTPVDGNRLMFRILDNGTSRTLTWDGTYTVIGVTLPTSTTANKTTYVGCIYNAAATRWDVVAVTTQA